MTEKSTSSSVRLHPLAHKRVSEGNEGDQVDPTLLAEIQESADSPNRRGSRLHSLEPDIGAMVVPPSQQDSVQGEEGGMSPNGKDDGALADNHSTASPQSRLGRPHRARSNLDRLSPEDLSKLLLKAMEEDGNLDSAADSLPSVPLTASLSEFVVPDPVLAQEDAEKWKAEAGLSDSDGNKSPAGDDQAANAKGVDSEVHDDAAALSASDSEPCHWLGYRPRPGMVKKMLRWDFNTLDWEPSELVPCLLEMLWHLGLVQKFNLEPDKVLRFSWNVRLRYRDVNPYHNFLHAISVVHVCFLVCAHSKTAQSILTPID